MEGDQRIFTYEVQFIESPDLGAAFSTLTLVLDSSKAARGGRGGLSAHHAFSLL